MPKSKQARTVACASCGTTISKKDACCDDESRMLCLECYSNWYEATFCETCGYKWNECRCNNYEYEEYEDVGDLYDNEDEESYEVDDYD